MPVTDDEILNEIELQFGKCMLPNILAHLIPFASSEKTIQGISIEEEFVYCSQDAIDEYFDTLAKFLPGIPRNVIYKVCEVGFDEWTDAIRRAVVAPVDYEEFTVRLRRNRSDSHASMIACVSAGGRALKPFVAIPRKTTEIEFYKCGFMLGVVLFAW
jgi:hypothetical protein